MTFRPSRFQPFHRNIHFGKRKQFLAQILQGSANVIYRFIDDEESVVETWAFHNLYWSVLTVEFLNVQLKSLRHFPGDDASRNAC